MATTRKRCHSAGEPVHDTGAGVSAALKKKRTTKSTTKTNKLSNKVSTNDSNNSDSIQSTSGSDIVSIASSSQPQSVSPQPTAIDNGPNQIPNQIDELKAIINQQQKTIDKLGTQVNFLLSFLGIDEKDNASPSNAPDLSDNQRPQQLHARSENDAVKTTAVDNAHSIKQTIMSTMYCEQHEKNKRANSLIVTGLPTMTEVNDSDIVAHLCIAEFNITPDIKNCRRIGKPIVGKPQPLLVTVNTVDEARTLISNARKLRNSADHHIRESVFINANLTKAESQAAYEERCRRRAAAATRQQNSDDTQHQSATVSTRVYRSTTRHQQQSAAAADPSTVGAATANTASTSANTHVDSNFFRHLFDNSGRHPQGAIISRNYLYDY